MPRVALALLLTAVCALLAAACGGSAKPATTGVSTTAGPTLAQLAGTPDATTLDLPNLIVMGGTDFPAGATIRLPFQTYSKDGSILKPSDGKAQLWIARSATSPARGPYPVQELSLAGNGITFEREDSDVIMVAKRVPLPEAGTWTALVTLQVDGKQQAASNQFAVLADEATPAVGAPAPSTPTPTLADVGGDAAKISTASPADTTLLRDSVSTLLREHRPFVVVFATPKFCTSRICGPIVDIVRSTQKAMAGTPMAFVHAEIYKELDPAKGTAPWVDAWSLPTEPWVFVVGADGKVKAKFEGAVTEQELETAARRALRN